MRRLSSIIGLVFLLVPGFAQNSPHGDTFAINCTDCHNTATWQVNPDQAVFKHSQTNFPLEGQHQQVNCKDCHQTLVFEQAQEDCNSCHTDMHQQTVGLECRRCHTPASWMVPNINQVHMMSRFPLLGAHANADCNECHTNMVTAAGNSSYLRFDPLCIECINCHKQDFAGTTSPNHVLSNFSTECTDCHLMNSFSWTGAGIDHSFFPLVEGHNISNCSMCHNEGAFSGLSPICYSCHQQNFQATTNPNHMNLGFSDQCDQCHTLNPGWKPARFTDHDLVSFPIYSGSHAGEWDNCADCHTNSANYLEFTCISCHEHNQTSTNNEHDEVSGYEYNSPACYACHPTGSGEGGFDHTKSAFPLTGAHTTTNCADCHTNGYVGTSSECNSCHLGNFTEAANPNHVNLSIPEDCSLCHTTNPGWQPATFPIHNDYYVLQGAHLNIANNCEQCHNQTYNNTPNTCYGCHQADYDNTNDPPHQSARFPITCLECHTETTWQPANFNHDGLYFPIYSGKHQNEWASCADCHTNTSDFSQFSCINCHEHNQTDMDAKHRELNAYTYNSIACFNCHPNGGGDRKSFKTTMNFH